MGGCASAQAADDKKEGLQLLEPMVTLVEACQRVTESQGATGVEELLAQLAELQATKSDLEGKTAEKLRKVVQAAEKGEKVAHLDRELEGLLSRKAKGVASLLKQGADVTDDSLKLTDLQDVAQGVGSVLLEAVTAIGECVPFLGLVVRLGRLVKDRYVKYRDALEAVHDLINCLASGVKVMQLFAARCRSGQDTAPFQPVWLSLKEALCLVREYHQKRVKLLPGDSERDAKKVRQKFLEDVQQLHTDLLTQLEERVTMVEEKQEELQGDVQEVKAAQVHLEEKVDTRFKRMESTLQRRGSVVSTANKTFGRPPLKDPHYLERPAFQAQVRQALEQKGHVMVAVSSPGGCGKTQLTVAVLQSLVSQYPYRLWLQAASRTELQASYAQVCSALGIKDVPAGEEAGKVQDWMQLHQPLLVVMDNVDHIYEEVKDLLPSTGHVLLTTRDGASLWEERGVSCVELEPFSATEGEALLGEPCQVLGERVGWLAVALNQALVFVRKKRKLHKSYSLTDYLQELERHAAVISKLDAVWLTSLSQLKPAVKQLLLSLCYLQPDHIELSLIDRWLESQQGAAWAQDLDAEEALESLLDYNLLRPADGLVSMHRLLRDALQRLDPERHVLREWLSFLDQEFWFDGNAVQHEDTALLAPHAASVCEAAAKLDLVTPATAAAHTEDASCRAYANSLMWLGRWHQFRGLYQEAALAFQGELVIREPLEGQEHPSVATTYDNLAQVYRAQGKYDEAVDLYKKALTIKEKTLGQEHPSSVATTYGNLGVVLKAQGKYDEAAEMQKKSLALKIKTMGQEHPSVAMTYNNLAQVYDSQGKYEEAVDLYKKSLNIKEKALGQEHPSVSTTYNNLGLVLDGQGKYDEAVALYKKALGIQEKTLGQEHPSVATTRLNMSKVAIKQGKYQEAVQLGHLSLATDRKVFGEESLDMGIDLTWLGLAVAGQGDLAVGMKHLEDALRLVRQAVGEAHPRVALVYHNQGEAALLHQDTAAAAERFRAALELRVQCLGLNHPETQETRRLLEKSQAQ